ncbi:hypothetical protein [Longimicrobium terrae]|nr:hypothetical protein [Longimicrobium terrae]
MNSEIRWIRFRIGDAFPAGSALGKWIAGLTLMANDILQSFDAMQREFAEGPDSPEGLFYFWLTCAQFREGAKLLSGGLEDSEIKKFIDTMDASDQSMLALIRPAFEPFAGSFVERIAKPIRDEFFHYPKPGSQRWDEVLSQMADLESGLRFRADLNPASTRGVFADELRTLYLIQYMGVSTDEIADVMRRLADYVGPMVRFAHGCLGSYIGRLPEGVVTHDL